MLAALHDVLQVICGPSPLRLIEFFADSPAASWPSRPALIDKVSLWFLKYTEHSIFIDS